MKRYTLVPALVLLALLACPRAAVVPPDPHPDAGNPDGGGPDAGPTDAGPTDAGPVAMTAALISTRIHTAEIMRAAREMQIGGEPFAQLLGYQVQGFDRALATTDQYTDPATGKRRTDPLGYSTAVESYEYSKQPMNQLSFEAGAGLSLIWGPLLGGTGQTRESASNGYVTRFQHVALAAIAAGRFRRPNLIQYPAPTNNPLNVYGWPGLWPVFAEFASFDPAIHPLPGAVPGCSFNGSNASTGYGGGSDAGGFSNYECDYNSLHLVDREAQVEKKLTPDALGYAAWKQGLWTINYWSALQDFNGNQIVSVAAADEPRVGTLGNSVVGKMDDGTGHLVDGVAGTYLGDNPMEGWQGLTMLDELDNKAALLLSALLSHDGASLTGAASVQAADDYSYDSSLLYFPAAISVTEQGQADAGEENRYFPKPVNFAIADAHSSLAGLSGLIGGFAEAFAMTDANNAEVGGSQQFRLTFDGDPFPSDDGLPNGQSTLHDRALGVLKIALVDLDRLHLDAANKVLVDTATVSGNALTRGSTVTTLELAESILAIRNAYRSLNGSLKLYSNDTPDTLGAPGALDAARLTGAPYTGTLQARLIALIKLQADFLAGKLIDANGKVANGYNLSTGAADASPTLLEAESAGLRGLLEAYVATSDQKYRDATLKVYADLSARFWMQDLRAYRTTAGESTTLKYTPLRFGSLQGALRQYYKLVASAPARKAEGDELLWRLTRMNKLVLNGWDDHNGDGAVQASECLAGRLQMGERVLTGELGLPADNGERDQDCVKEISVVGLPAALGAELDLTRQ